MTLEELKVVLTAEMKPYKESMEKVRKETQKTSNEVSKQTGAMGKSFTKLKGVVAGLAIGAAIGKIATDSIRTAMQVEASMQQIDRLMGENSQGFKNWAKQNALSFNMAQSDAMKYGAIYSNLLTSFMPDSSAVTEYTTELLKASSIIASGTGRTMDDVMERIRSGMLGNTEAIEDLGVNVNVAMLESTEAFKRFAGDSSWNQLDFQTQQQIRLFGILEQTSTKFGDSVLQNSNSSLQQFLAILKDVSLNIGNAFLPIWNIVMPILIGFASKLREVTGYLATFMQLLFGKKAKSPIETSSKAASNALGSAAGSANDISSGLGKAASNAKKIKDNLGGLGDFDDFNILQTEVDDTSSGSAGSDGGGGSLGGFDMGSSEDWTFPEPDTSGIESAVAKVKKLYGEVKDFIVDNKVPIISALAGISAAIAYLMVGPQIVASVMSVVGWFKNFVTVAQSLGILKTVLLPIQVLFAGISTPMLLAAAAIGVVTAAIVYLWQTSESFRNDIIGIIDGIVSVLSNLWDSVLAPLFDLLASMFTTILVPIGAFLFDVLCVAIQSIVAIVSSLFTNILVPFANFLINMLGIALKGVVDIWNSWKPAIEIAMGIIKAIWDTVLKPFIDFLVDVVCAAIEHFGNFIQEVFTFVQDIFQGYIDFLVGIFTLDFNKAFEGIKQIVDTVMGLIVGIWETAWDGISSFFGDIWNGISEGVDTAINKVKDTIKSVLDTIKGVWESMWNGLKNFVSNTWNFIIGIFNTGGKIFDGIVGGIGDVFKSIVNTLLGGINKVIAVPFNTINGLLNTIRNIDLPVIGKPFKGLWGQNPLPVPQIPQLLAKGGVVDSATLAVVGEAGKEVVMPLENNTGWIGTLASKINRFGGDDEVTSLLQELIDVLRNKNMTLNVDGKDINKSSNKGSGEFAMIF